MIFKTTPVAGCPMCQGTGQEYNTIHHMLLRCTLCEGRGWVPVMACRGCGKPAYKWWPRFQVPIIQYCGLETCFSVLIKLHISRPKIADTKEFAIQKVQEHSDQMQKIRDQLLRRSVRL